MLSFVDIEEARERIKDQIYLSPFPHSETISRMTGNKVFFKLENLQLTGSFKERGALNRLLKVFQLEKNFVAGHPADRFRMRKRREIDLIFDALARLFSMSTKEIMSIPS